MAQSDTLPALTEAILRACAEAREPWLAEEFARQHDLDPQGLLKFADLLCQINLLAPVEVPPAGRGYVLTEAGRQVLAEPDCQARLRTLFHPGDDWPDAETMATPEGQYVQETMSAIPPPRFARWLLWANLLVFAAGIYLANQRNIRVEDYLTARVAPGVEQIFRDLGLMKRGDLSAGQWWRVLSCCFVHIGFIHLAFNMLAFNTVGKDIEWLMGSRRFLLVFLLSCAGGTAGAFFLNPRAQGLAGASGAVCGLLAAEAVWLLIYKRYLPRRLASSQLTSLFMSGGLILLISLHPNVSGGGHLGGALAGGLACLALHWLRFGGSARKGLGLGLLLLLPVVSLLLLRHAETPAPPPAQQGENKDDDTPRPPPPRQPKKTPQRLAFEKAIQPILTIDRQIRDFEAEMLSRVLVAPVRRDPQEVEKALGKISEFRLEVKAIQDDLAAVKNVPQELKAGQDYFAALARYLEAVEQTLKSGKDWQGMQHITRQLRVTRERWDSLVGEP